MSPLETEYLRQVMLTLPEPEREYRFALDVIGWVPGQRRVKGDPTMRERLRAANLRDWRFDFAWPDHGLAVEIDGGTVYNLGRGQTPGRHARPRGVEGDARKIAAATLLGWAVLRFTRGMIRDGTALQCTEGFLMARSDVPPQLLPPLAAGAAVLPWLGDGRL